MIEIETEVQSQSSEPRVFDPTNLLAALFADLFFLIIVEYFGTSSSVAAFGAVMALGAIFALAKPQLDIFRVVKSCANIVIALAIILTVPLTVRPEGALSLLGLVIVSLLAFLLGVTTTSKDFLQKPKAELVRYPAWEIAVRAAIILAVLWAIRATLWYFQPSAYWVEMIVLVPVLAAVLYLWWKDSPSFEIRQHVDRFEQLKDLIRANDAQKNSSAGVFASSLRDFALHSDKFTVGDFASLGLALKHLEDARRRGQWAKVTEVIDLEILKCLESVIARLEGKETKEED